MTKTFEFTKGAFRLWYKLHIKVFAARLTGEVVGVKKAWEEKTVGGVPKHPTKHLSAPKHPHQATNPCSQTSLPQQLLPPYQLMTDFQGLGPISIVILTFESFMSFGIIHKGRGQVYSTAQIERCRKWKRRGKCLFFVYFVDHLHLLFVRHLQDNLFKHIVNHLITPPVIYHEIFYCKNKSK